VKNDILSGTQIPAAHETVVSSLAKSREAPIVSALRFAT
jgi:hypothetical protein